jgi:hypothetical protein
MRRSQTAATAERVGTQPARPFGRKWTGPVTADGADSVHRGTLFLG